MNIDGDDVITKIFRDSEFINDTIGAWIRNFSYYSWFTIY